MQETQFRFIFLAYFHNIEQHVSTVDGPVSNMIEAALAFKVAQKTEPTHKVSSLRIKMLKH